MSDISQASSLLDVKDSQSESESRIPIVTVEPTPRSKLQSYLDSASFVARSHMLTAARVRPFLRTAQSISSSPSSDASESDPPAVSCVSMTDAAIIVKVPTTMKTAAVSASSAVPIKQPSNQPMQAYQFELDRHYWSHSGFQVDAETGERIAATTTATDAASSSSPEPPSGSTNIPSKYASQQSVYDDIGSPMVSALFAGKPSVSFAWGEEMSGKSYTLLGDPSNPGLLHRIGADVFAAIDLANSRASSNSDDAAVAFRYTVEFGMLEHYLECFRDLLAAPVSIKELDNYPFRLKEDHKVLEGYHPVRVDSFKHMLQLIAQGLLNQSTTSVNPPHAHTLYSLSLVKTSMGESANGAVGSSASSVRSTLTLVELAASNREFRRPASKYSMREVYE